MFQQRDLLTWNYTIIMINLWYFFQLDGTSMRTTPISRRRAGLSLAQRSQKEFICVFSSTIHRNVLQSHAIFIDGCGTSSSRQIADPWLILRENLFSMVLTDTWVIYSFVLEMLGSDPQMRMGRGSLSMFQEMRFLVFEEISQPPTEDKLFLK